MVESDEKLMVQVAEGHQASFTILYNRYKLRLYRYIYRMTGDSQMAEDIFQETFLRLYRYAPRYKPVAHFSTFLYRIATNLVLNEMKRRKIVSFITFSKKSESFSDGTQYEESIPDGTHSPEDSAYLDQLSEHLQRAVNLLPETMRATFLLSEYEEKKYEEIATILDCSLGTVKSRVNRARNKILKYLETHEIM